MSANPCTAVVWLLADDGAGEYRGYQLTCQQPTDSHTGDHTATAAGETDRDPDAVPVEVTWPNHTDQEPTDPTTSGVELPLGMAGIAGRLGVSSPRTWQLRAQEGFPAPTWRHQGRDYWTTGDIRGWAATTGRSFAADTAADWELLR